MKELTQYETLKESISFAVRNEMNMHLTESMAKLRLKRLAAVAATRTAGAIGVLGAISLVAAQLLGFDDIRTLSAIPAVLGTVAFTNIRMIAKDYIREENLKDFENTLEALKKSAEERDNIFRLMSTMSMGEAEQYLKTNSRLIKKLTDEQMRLAAKLRLIMTRSIDKGTGGLDHLSVSFISEVEEMIEAASKGSLTFDEKAASATKMVAK